MAGGLSRCGVMVLCRHKRPMLAIHREQVRHHLSSYRQRRAIRMPFLFFFLVHRGQFVAQFRSKLRRFDQYTLNVLVPLFRKRRSQYLICRALLVAAQPQ
jgi:hypothetical protein